MIREIVYLFTLLLFDGLFIESWMECSLFWSILSSGLRNIFVCLFFIHVLRHTCFLPQLYAWDWVLSVIVFFVAETYRFSYRRGKSIWWLLFFCIVISSVCIMHFVMNAYQYYNLWLILADVQTNIFYSLWIC